MTNLEKLNILRMWGYMALTEEDENNRITALDRIWGPGIDYDFVKADGDVTNCVQFAYERVYWYIWGILSNDA